ncbi:MAG: transporter, partial [Geobacter sp.]|nr:transporter [Geobacter sp.]
MPHCRRLAGLAFTATLLSTTPLFAADATLNFQFNQPANSMQSASGGAEAIIYQSDTSTLNTVILSEGVFSSGDQPELPGTSAEPDKASTAEPVASIGASTFFSPYLKVYSVPLSYTFFNNLRVKTSIPYLQRTIKRNGVEFKANGLGDVSLGLEYRWWNGEKLQLSTSADMILPTGDNEAKATNGSDQLTVPLGSGAFSVYGIQHITYQINQDWRIFGNAGIRYFTNADYVGFPSVMPVANAVGQKIHEEKGMAFSGMV